MPNNKKDFYKVNVIFIAFLTLLFGLITYSPLKQHAFQNYSTSEISLWLFFPFFTLLFSLLVSKIIVSISNSIENSKPNNENKIWKNLFFFSLANTLIFLLVPLIYYLEKGMNIISITQNFKSLNGFDYFIISVLAGYSFGFLYSIFSKKKKYYLLLVILLCISGFLMSLISSINLSVNTKQPQVTDTINGELYQEFDEVPMAQEGESGNMSYQEGQESKYQDSIKSLKYYFYFQDTEHIPYGAYFADLWDNPLQDKDSTQHALLNFITDYLNVRKKNSVGDYIDNISFDSGYRKLTSQSLKIMAKIDSDGTKLLRSFKSYEKLIYFLFSNEIYKDSGLKNLTQLLLQTHKELYKNKAVLDEIYYIMNLPYEDQSHFGRSDYYLDLKVYISDEIVQKLESGENFYKHYGSSTEISSYTKGEAVWLYTFWARRYKEKNDDAVFQILNEINNHYQ